MKNWKSILAILFCGFFLFACCPGSEESNNKKENWEVIKAKKKIAELQSTIEEIVAERDKTEKQLQKGEDKILELGSVSIPKLLELKQKGFAQTVGETDEIFTIIPELMSTDDYRGYYGKAFLFERMLSNSFQSDLEYDCPEYVCFGNKLLISKYGKLREINNKINTITHKGLYAFGKNPVELYDWVNDYGEIVISGLPSFVRKQVAHTVENLSELYIIAQKPEFQKEMKTFLFVEEEWLKTPWSEKEGRNTLEKKVINLRRIYSQKYDFSFYDLQAAFRNFSKKPEEWKAVLVLASEKAGVVTLLNVEDASRNIDENIAEINKTSTEIDSMLTKAIDEGRELLLKRPKTKKILESANTDTSNY